MEDDEDVEQVAYPPLLVKEDKNQFNKVKKLSKRDIGGGGNYEPSIDQLFARRQKVLMV